MRARRLLKVSVAASPEAEEAVSELLERTFDTPASAYLDMESGGITVSVYLGQADKWNPAARATLQSGLAAIRKAGLGVAREEIQVNRLKAQDWAESWKRHFPPIRVGRKLLVIPGWLRRKPLPGQQVVVLNPGLSFGTGQHPTTAFCLKEVVRSAPALKGTTQPSPSFLDAGCGSGILAIAAAKLGCRPIDAVEIDTEAVRLAKANARRNGVGRRIRFHSLDLARFNPGRRYSLVCANLVSNLLLAERDRLLRRVQPGGTLVLAGILETEFPMVQKCFEEAGARLVRGETRKEWRSGSFRVDF